MALGRLLRSLPKGIWNRRDTPLYLSACEFQHEAWCERLRVDRNGSQLALLTIRLPRGRTEIETTVNERLLANY